MATKTVQDLALEGAPAGTDHLIIDDGATTRKATVSDVVASVDNDTTYTAGTGLTLLNTVFSVDNPYPTADETKVGHLTVTQAVDLDTIKSKLDGIEAGATADQTQADINALGITATAVDLGNWTVEESAGVLYFKTLGVSKMKLDASGNLTVVGDVTAFGTI